MINLNKFERKYLSIIFAIAILINLSFMLLNKSINLINLGIFGTVLINIFIIYKLGLLITRNNKIAALLPAFTIAVIPLWPNIRIINELPQLLLALSSIFFLLSIYTLLNLKKVKLGIFFPIIAIILHPSAALLIPAFIGYFILAMLEHHKIAKKEIIYATLSIVFIILISFLSINISAIKLQAQMFTEIKQIIGLIPMYLGMVGAYFGFRHNNKRSLLLLSAGGSCLILLFFNIIVVESLLLYLGLSFAALSSLLINGSQKLIRISKFKKQEKKYILYLFIAVLVSSIVLWI